MQLLELESGDFAEITALATELQQKLQVRAMEFLPSRATRTRVESELTSAALQAFAAKAKLITEAMGASRYEVVEVTVGGTPAALYKAQRGVAMPMAAEAARTPIAVEGGTATLTVTASGQIQLR